ncbi:arylsulfatase [Klebsiella pneumoniae]|uniref:Arylsulfatase n=1 Tax=Klebsiella pneumoniae TaxID=573 RepID=A0A3S4GFM3_KLEPN|nr:arylsulfatase [Klebsiella pneumoniae]
MQKKVAGSDSVINALKDENQKLKNELVVAQKKVNAANLQLDDKQRTIIMPVVYVRRRCGWASVCCSVWCCRIWCQAANVKTGG